MHTSGRVYACLGEHDAPVKRNNNPAIVNFVEMHCGGANYYSFDVQDVHFASVYLHPGHRDARMLSNSQLYKGMSNNSLAWLTNDLMMHRQSRIILFWHLDTEGARSGWWSDVEQRAVYGLLKHFDVKHIFVGHTHTNFTYYWQYGASKQIPVSHVSNDYYAVVDVSRDDLSVVFVDEAGREKRWIDLLKIPAELRLIVKERVPKQDLELLK